MDQEVSGSNPGGVKCFCNRLSFKSNSSDISRFMFKMLYYWKVVSNLKHSIADFLLNGIFLRGWILSNIWPHFSSIASRGSLVKMFATKNVKWGLTSKFWSFCDLWIWGKKKFTRLFYPLLMLSLQSVQFFGIYSEVPCWSFCPWSRFKKVSQIAQFFNFYCNKLACACLQ